jgi:hypothetical protein
MSFLRLVPLDHARDQAGDREQEVDRVLPEVTLLDMIDLEDTPSRLVD